MKNKYEYQLSDDTQTAVEKFLFNQMHTHNDHEGIRYFYDCRECASKSQQGAE